MTSKQATDTRSLLLALAVTALVAACGPAASQDASTLKIRQGAVVAAGAGGPERVSTVALYGQVGRSSFTCSASVLADDLLITAAHCIEDGARLYAYFGLDLDDAVAADLVPVAQAVVHPDYEGSGSEITPHDIAVLKLGKRIPSAYRAAPLLTSSVTLQEDELVRLAGFGITERGGDSGRLRYVDTTYVGTDDDGRLAIDDPEKRGACSGDSGGPLYVKRGSTWYLGGVLSGGPIPCRGVNFYTGVATHADFVRAAKARLAP